MAAPPPTPTTPPAHAAWHRKIRVQNGAKKRKKSKGKSNQPMSAVRRQSSSAFRSRAGRILHFLHFFHDRLFSLNMGAATPSLPAVSPLRVRVRVRVRTTTGTGTGVWVLVLVLVSRCIRTLAGGK